MPVSSALPRPVPAQQLISLHAGAPLRLRAPDNGAAVLCFTSGTTAAPKVQISFHMYLKVAIQQQVIWR